MTIKQHVRKLEKLLITAANFSKVAEYFFDHLAENSEFTRQGGRVEHDALESILAVFAQRLADAEDATDVVLIKPNIHGMIHGFCLLGDRNTVVLYFEKSDIGLLIVSPSEPGGNTDFFRFRVLGVVKKDKHLHVQTAPGIQ